MKIKIWVAVYDMVNSTTKRTIEIDDEDWVDLSEQEKDETIFEEIMNASLIEWGYSQTDE